MTNKIKLLAFLTGLALICGAGIVFAQETHTGQIEPQITLIEPLPEVPSTEPIEPPKPAVWVWFKLNISKNQAIDLIESFGSSKYQLSGPGWDETSWSDNIGGMAVIEVPEGSEQECIQKFKESNIVQTADLNIVYEATEAVNLDEDVQPEDLGVSEPTILPDSPFYFLKNWVRGIQGLLTLDPIAKAKLKEKFANEKLIELKKLIEENKSQKTIEKGIKNYQKGVEELKTATDKIKEKAEENPKVSEFLDKFIQQQTLHQQILQKLETKVPTTTFEKIQEAREQHLERFSEVMNKLEANKEKIQERLEQTLEKISTSTLQKISTSTKETIIKIRDRVMEKIQLRNAGGTTTTEACITLWDPVCGKDGKTYSNTCFAKQAEIEVDHRGDCK